MPHNTLIGRFAAVIAFIIMTLYMRYIVHNKIVFTFHNVESHNRLNPKLEKLLFKYCIKIAHAVIVHNAYSKKRLLELYDKNSIYEKKICIIPHGNYHSYYPNKITKQEARTRLKIPQNSFVVLVFGEMRPKAKGIEDILDSIENYPDMQDNVYFLFAGKSKDGKLQNQIEKMCTKQRKKVGCHLFYIPDDEIQYYMNACDVGIVPYRKISTSGSVMLYMSFGKPVIVSRLPPLIELLGQDYPLYCNPSDPSSIVSAIGAAHKMAKSGQSFAYDRILTCYNWEDIAKKTEQLYDSL